MNLFFVGAEIGVDPVEIGDFLGGLLGFDFRGDDFPRTTPVVPEFSSGLAVGTGTGMFKVEDKPVAFESLAARLDYLHTNVQKRVSEPIRTTDAYFAADQANLIVPPQTQMRVQLYTVFTETRQLNFQFSPDIQLDVELPNLKDRMRIFVETAKDNALPGTYTADQEDRGLNVGARKTFDRYHLSLDAGIRAVWLPESFVRAIWGYEWTFGNWSIRPDERIFYQGRDGLGAMSSLYVNRWIGESKIGLLKPTTSAKYTSDSDTLSWSLNIDAIRVPLLLDETRRGYSVNWEDAARAQGLRYSAFGSHGVVDKQRIVFGFRGPLYRKWIYWDLNPGLEWNRDNAYETTYIIQVGVDMLFWGQAYE